MFCRYCGKSVGDDTRFCRYCGKELISPVATNTVIINDPVDNAREPGAFTAGNANYGSTVAGGTGSKKRRRGLIPLIIVALIAVFCVTGFVVYSTAPGNRYDKKIAAGDKYLSELNYKEAIASFQEAIKIDPSNPEGYSKLAKAYVGDGDYENAMDALYEGYENTDSHSLIVTEADICLDYVDILQGSGDLDKAVEVLEKRYEETGDDRLKQEKEKIEEKRRAKEEEARRAAEEAARQQEAEDCLARHNELLAQLGEGFEEGTVLQNFAFYDENRNVVHVSDFLGKAVYFNFFTTWCPYCFYEIPDMQSVADKYQEDAIVIMIDLGETVSEAKQYAKDYGITMPIYYLDSWQAGDLVIEGVPHSIIIDRFGRVQGVHPGMSDYDWMNRTMEKAVKSE